ncbi:HNH endonuclease [Escherichia coli]|nr:HNH endonuclease [Escherichia coli]EHP4101902.1 HNH endonuclease [Escherichia coli]EIX3383188.1 HNH endonuclease [Escherichia coli]EKK9460490.1 HNH endonuclease [Escherichia coli]ELO4079707.1 HNH endonuclease [Escherichia coli]
MAVLRTLPGRIKTLNTRRVNVLKGEQRRVSGSARVSLKRRIWLRDAGQCCLCGRVVDLCDSELDHRIALQFGGGNEETNLWTLCTECHRQKSVSETASGMPDPTLPEVMAGQTISSDCDPPRGGGSSGEKNDRPGHRPPSHAEKKFPFQGS